MFPVSIGLFQSERLHDFYSHQKTDFATYIASIQPYFVWEIELERKIEELNHYVNKDLPPAKQI